MVNEEIYFKGICELPCGWTVEEEFYNAVIKPELRKMRHTEIMAEFMFKCLYKGEKPLSKEDYKRTRFTHRKIWSKRTTLAQVRTKNEVKAFAKKMRRWKIEKGVYPLGLNFEEALKNEEIKKYYEDGLYAAGSFVEKVIVPINKL